MPEVYQRCTDARVLVVSLRNAYPDVARCCAFEFEDVILEVDRADLLAPRLSPTEFASPLLRRATLALERRTPLLITRKQAPTKTAIDRDYEVLFLICQRPTDLRLLDSIVGWRERCKRVVCWIEELWVGSIKWDRVLAPIRPFDHAFVGCRGSVEPLQAATGVRCTYGVPAVNVERFSPYPNPPARTIDCYSMGRRAPASHDALYARSKQGDFHYLFDTVPSQRDVYDVAQHRTYLASLIKRARYFVANMAKADMADQTGGQEEVGLRFFEGAAGGAFLLGAKPRSEIFDEHFGWPDACINIPWNAPDFASVIESLDREPERVAAAQHRNAVESLRRHDWSYRWRDVLTTLGLSPLPQLAQREARLRAIAEAAEKSHP